MDIEWTEGREIREEACRRELLQVDIKTPEVPIDVIDDLGVRVEEILLGVVLGAWLLHSPPCACEATRI